MPNTPPPVEFLSVSGWDLTIRLAGVGHELHLDDDAGHLYFRADIALAKGADAAAVAAIEALDEDAVQAAIDELVERDRDDRWFPCGPITIAPSMRREAA